MVAHALASCRGVRHFGRHLIGKERRQQRTDIALERETPLNALDGVELVMSVPTVNLEPGRYRFLVKVNAKDRDQRPVRGVANFSFELRSRNADTELEILRRESWRRLLQKDYIGARQAAADLLRLHPDSINAYGILADIAKAEGKQQEAASHRKNAEAISRSGRDQLADKYRSRRREIFD